LNQFGKEKNERNRIEINQFEPVFSSVQFDSKNKKKSVWLLILVQNRTEPEMLSPKFRPYVFLGYSSTQNAYICIAIDNSHIYLSKHVIFDETIFPFTFSTIMSYLVQFQVRFQLTPPYRQFHLLDKHLPCI